MKISCDVCGKPIEPLSEGFALQSVNDGKISVAVYAHKGSCDQRIDPQRKLDSLPLDYLAEFARSNYAKRLLSVAAEMLASGELTNVPEKTQ